MKKILLVVTLLLVGCTTDETAPINDITPGSGVEEIITDPGSGIEEVIVEPGLSKLELSFDFTTGAHEWIYEVTDYPVNVERAEWDLVGINGTYDMTGTDESAYWLIGNNHSDDIFVYIYLKVDGLKANTTYEGLVEFTGLTPYSSDSMGIGGSPASSVYVKAAMTSIEPTPVIGYNDYYVLPEGILKENQSQDGEIVRLLGSLADNQITLDNGLFQVSYDLTQEFTTNDAGEVFIMVGYDSGFEGVNIFGLTALDIDLKEVE